MGDYVHLFADETERTQYERSAQYNEPYISATDDTFDAEYNKRQDKHYGVKYTDLENNMHDFTFVEYDAEVEYLESTGTQYINLDFGFDKTDEIYTSFAILTTTNDKYINSPITWNNNNNRFGMGYHNGGYCIGYGNTGTSNTLLSPKTANDKQIHNWEYKNYIFKIVDLNLTRNVSSITFGGTTKNLRLFYGYNAATQAKIASYKHIKNGQPVIDLIPVRVGNTGYMYDKVSCKLLGNSGSGNFVLGPDKYDAQIEYLQSSYNQVIETGIIPDINFGYDCYISMIPDSNTNYGYKYIGYASMANWANNMAGFGYAANGNNKITFYWKSTYKSALNVNSSKIHIIWKNGTCNVSDASGQSTSFRYDKTSTISSGVGFQIFNVGINWSESIKNTYGGKLYSFKLYSSNELTRDFIPVRVGNIGYLYDKVYGKLYGNAGNGQFILGPDV